MSRIASLALEARPRERLLKFGAHRLEPAELLALVLGTGRGGPEDVLELAERIMVELGGIEALANADAERLQQVRGIGPVKATRIRAAFELALRAATGDAAPGWEAPWGASDELVTSVPVEAGGDHIPAPDREVHDPDATILGPPPPTSLDPVPGVSGPVPSAEVPGASDAAPRGATQRSSPARDRSKVRADEEARGRAEEQATGSHGPTINATADEALSEGWLDRIDQLRGQVPTGETALLGVVADPTRPPLTLALGEGLGSGTRPGAVLARLLAAGGGPWWLAAVRPQGRPRAAELVAAARIREAAALVGVGLTRIVVVGRVGHWLLPDDVTGERTARR